MRVQPPAVKDVLTTGQVSTGGKLGRRDYVPGTEATVVARARAAGAILMFLFFGDALNRAAARS